MGNPKRDVDLFAQGVDTEHPQFVTAVARAFSILRCFEHGEPYLGNQDIARRTGLPKPTISRFTFTLAGLGYVEYSAQLEKYCLGAAVLGLSHAYMKNNDVVTLARPLMRELADYTHAAVMLGAADGLRMVLLEVCQGDATFQLKLEVGARAARLHRARPCRSRRTAIESVRAAPCRTRAGMRARAVDEDPRRPAARTPGLRELRFLLFARRLESRRLRRGRAHGIGRSRPRARFQLQRARIGDDAGKTAARLRPEAGGAAQQRLRDDRRPLLAIKTLQGDVGA
jgi:hypothetical protein